LTSPYSIDYRTYNYTNSKQIIEREKKYLPPFKWTADEIDADVTLQ